MFNYETISCSIDERVATLQMNRAKVLNAISQKMRHELIDVIRKLEAQAEVRVVVLCAEGKGFCSGADLSEGLAGFDTIHDKIQEEHKPIFEAIAQSEKIYIAAAQGACVGIGASLALACDLVVMSDNAFLYLAFAGLSLVPDGGISHHLVHAMGYKKAYQTFLEAGRLKAEDCLKYDLVNKVVPLESLLDESLSWAKKLSEGAPIAQKFGKQIMRAAHESTFIETFDKESFLQTDAMSSKDHQNALDAFFAKKVPVFSGK